MIIRLIDIFAALFGLLMGGPLLAVIWLIVRFDTLAPMFRQERMGRHKKPFVLVKFRTMRPDTESVATHLAEATQVTQLGQFLRRTKLDELPQLWNVLIGDMSLVGPRPNLYNQVELIQERDALDVYKIRPGITGLAQINHIDMATPKLLAKTDAEMINTLSIYNYFKYIFLTISGYGKGDRIRL